MEERKGLPSPLDGLEKWARWAEARLSEKSKNKQDGNLENSKSSNRL
jgi:hypothetical protein